MRIVLSAVGIARAIDGDDLMPHGVVARRDIVGDGELPHATLLEEEIGRPSLRVGLEETVLRAFEEPELGLVDGLARTIAVGQISHDRALVRGRPNPPEELDLITTFDGDVSVSRSSALVADDIGALVVSREDGATISVLGSWPSDLAGFSRTAKGGAFETGQDISV